MSVKLRTKDLKGGRKSLYLDIYSKGMPREKEFLELYLEKGSQHRQANKETKALAQQICVKRQFEISSGKHKVTPRFQKKGDFLKYFEQHFGKKSGYPSVLNRLRKFRAKIKFCDLTEKFILDFEEHLLKEVSNNSARQYMVLLKRVLKKALTEKKIDENPFEGIKNLKRNDSEIVYLTLEEVKKLSSTDYSTNPDVRRAFLFACFSGLRYSDLVQVTGKALVKNESKYQLNFRQEKTEGFVYFPLSKTAVKVLQNGNENLNLPQNKTLFKLPGRKHYNKHCKRWAKTAGIEKNISSHVGRHTFAIMCLQEGITIYTLSKLLGHKSIQTTEIYARVLDKMKDQAVEKLPEIEIGEF